MTSAGPAHSRATEPGSGERPPRGNAGTVEEAPPTPTPVPPAGGAAESDSPTVPQPDNEAPTVLPRALKAIASVVAPGTILTTLMIYFGLLYAIGYYRHFGVNYTVLELPVQDYLVLSSDAAVVPLAILAAATLLALWLYRLPDSTISDNRRKLMRRAISPVVIAVGLALVGSTVVDLIWGIPMYAEIFWEARGLSLATGVLVIAYGGRIFRIAALPRTRTHRPEATEAMAVGKISAITILVGIGLFWAVGSYGIAVGAGRAEGITAALACQSEVILYSEKSLNLTAPGVTTQSFENPNVRYQFRYSGLRLVPQSGPWYLFLPESWSPSKSPAILLRRSDTIRLEFYSSGGPNASQC